MDTILFTQQERLCFINSCKGVKAYPNSKINCIKLYICFHKEKTDFSQQTTNLFKTQSIRLIETIQRIAVYIQHRNDPTLL